MIAALPIRLNLGADGADAETCVRLADRPPASGATALTELERCRALVPNDVELLVDLADAYGAAGREADAQQAYADALRLDPGYADVHVRLATLLLRRGAARDAREHALQALRIQPNRATVRQLLMEIDRR
jgi:cytochrome c-type biogenesis protein CcmH/NrfG